MPEVISAQKYAEPGLESRQVALDPRLPSSPVMRQLKTLIMLEKEREV